MTTLYPQVKVGAAEVYVSGTVLCRPGQIIEITPVPTAAPFPYRLRLSFVENPLIPSRVDVVNQPENGVLVTITNFGVGTTSTSAPLNVGLLGGAPLLLDIAGTTTGSGASLLRVISFTVTQGQP